MARALMLAWSSPRSPDRASEFDEWYEQTHIPQIRAAVPSITAASRFELVDPESPGPSHRYLAVYELDDDDIPAAAAALADAGASGHLQMTPAMDLTVNPPVAQWYRRAHAKADHD
jgi:hypothetical protein